MKEGETIMDNYLTENIDTVIFDIGNVLIHFAWEDYLHDLGYEGAMFDRVADAYFAVMTGIKVIPDFTQHRSGLTRLLKMIRRLREISAKCSKDLARLLSRIR